MNNALQFPDIFREADCRVCSGACIFVHICHNRVSLLACLLPSIQGIPKDTPVRRVAPPWRKNLLFALPGGLGGNGSISDSTIQGLSRASGPNPILSQGRPSRHRTIHAFRQFTQMRRGSRPAGRSRKSAKEMNTLRRQARAASRELTAQARRKPCLDCADWMPSGKRAAIPPPHAPWLRWFPRQTAQILPVELQAS